jgi:hypothetical protein
MKKTIMLLLVSTLCACASHPMTSHERAELSRIMSEYQRQSHEAGQAREMAMRNRQHRNTPMHTQCYMLGNTLNCNTQ